MALLSVCNIVWAAPEGGQIVGGSGSILQSGKLTEINQQSNRLAIDWQRFDVAADERVRFVQPSRDAVALNRILDSKASTILGRVDANGTLFLVNPRGIIFGKGAVVNASALVASDLDISSEDFMAGNYQMASQGLVSTGVINQGEIEAAVGGSVTLLGTVISNEGRISATEGSIQLVAADEVVITFQPEGEVGVLVNRALLSNDAGIADAVKNSGELIAEGGQVLLAGHVTSDLYSHAVNNEGIIEATSLDVGEGYIELSGNGGKVANSGTLDASGDTGHNGGQVTIRADEINNSGRVDVSGDSAGNVYMRAETIHRQSGNSVIDATSQVGNGGTVELYGQRVGLLDETRVDVSGESGGGTLLVGGDYQGGGDFRSELTIVGDQVQLVADAGSSGDGGKVIVWSDKATIYQGQIFARGGSGSGDGGFVEVSGKEDLQFVGQVDTSAANGSMGSLLLDPATITILDGAAGGTNDGAVLDGLISSGDDFFSNYFITEAVLESLTSNVTLEARNSITINNLSDNELCFHCVSGSGNVIFRVPGSSNNASFSMNTGDTINVSNGNLTIEVNATSGDAASITAGHLVASGDISVLASSDGGGFSPLGDVTVSTQTITSSGGNVTLSSIVTADASGNIFANAGNAYLTTKFIDVSSGGNVSITATSTMNAGITLGPSAGDAIISVEGTSINGAGTFSVTSDSVVTGFGSSGTGYINMQGNYDVGSTGNNGFIDLNADNIVLVADVGLSVVNDGTGGAPIGGVAGSVNGGGFNLSMNVDEGTFSGIQWSDFSNLGSLLLQQSNTIHIADGGAGAGDMTISQADLNTIDNATNNLTLTAGGNIVSGAVTYNNFNNVTLNAGDSFSTTGATSTTGAAYTVNTTNTLVQGHSLSSGGGAVAFSAGSDITASSSISTGGGNIGISSTAGDILFAASGGINAGAGQVGMIATGNIRLTGISTTNATASAVSVQSTGGSILDAGDVATDISATSTGAVVTLSAVSGIGDDATASDYGLELNVDSLTANNTTSNNIDLNLVGNNTLSGGITNGAAGGALLIDSSGSLTIDTALSTSNGDIALGAGTSLAMNSGSSIDAGSAAVDLSAAGDITLTSVSSSSASATAVQVTSSGGAILDGDVVDDIDISATAGGVVLAAANGIGDNAAATDYQLDVDANTIVANNSTANDINLAIVGDVDLDGSIVNSAAGGGLVIDASGALSVSTAVTTSNGIIDLTGGTTLTMNAGSSLDAGSGAVSLAANDDIALTAVTTTNTSAAAVQVTSTAGAILDGDASDDVDITATGGRVVLNAANGIGDDATATDLVLEINASELSATNTTANNIDLSLTGNSTLAGAVDNQAVGGSLLIDAIGGLAVDAAVTSSDGTIDLSAGTTLAMTDGASIDAGAGVVNLTATNDIAVTSITTSNATLAAVQITSASGAIVDGDTVDNIDISASNGRVTLDAANGIGDDATATDYRLEIDAADIVVSNSTANNIDMLLSGDFSFDSGISNGASGGGLVLGTTGSLGVNSAITTNNGSVVLIAGTSLAMTDSGSVNAGNSTISLSAVNDIAVTSLATTSNSATAVQVTSSAGAILDGDSVDDLDISAAAGTVVLSAANGIGDDASATDYSLEIDAADISVTNSTANNIDLMLSGDITLSSGFSNAAAGGGLLLGSTGSLLVDTTVVTNDGIIDLSAGTGLTMNAGSSLDAGNATINLSATDDIALTSLATTNATASAVLVSSSAGAIVDGDSIDDVDITAASAGAVVTLNAATGIGSVGNALELDTPTVSLSTTSGDIAFSNTGNLAVSGLSTGDGSVDISAGGSLLIDSGGISVGGSTNSISLSATGGDLQVDGAVSTANGSISLASSADIVINNSISTNDASISADAADDITVTGSGAIAAGTGTVMLAADSGAGDSIGALTINAGGTVSGGTVSLSAAQDLAVTGVQGSSVNLTSGQSIVDSDSAATDVTVTNVAGVLTLAAGGGVGVGDALETNTGNLVLATDVAHNISNTGDLSVAGVSGHSGGDITLATSGDLSLAASAISDSSALNLTAGGDVGISTLTSAGALTVTSSTLSIGTASVDSLSSSAVTTVSSAVSTTNNFSTNGLVLAAGAGLNSGGSLASGDITAAASGTHTLASSGDMVLGNISGTGSALNLSSAANMTLGSVTTGGGDFSAQVDTDANQVATLSAAAISAGNINLAGGADNNDRILVSGQLSGTNITAINLDRLDLQRVVASGTLDLAANDMRLSDSLVASDTLHVMGGISLLNHVLMDSTGGGTASGSLVEVEGTVTGNGFNLALNAGSHVACTDNAVLSGIGTFSVTNSIKTVLDQVSASTIDLRSSQEIHLNGSISATSATFNADTNNDGVGIVSLLDGQSINAGVVNLVGVTAQVSASTPATCSLPTGLPAMPALLDPALLAVIAQESERYEEATVDTFATNAPNVTYLDASCQPSRRNSKTQQDCALDESVRNFLGTFLIDFQLPAR